MNNDLSNMLTAKEAAALLRVKSQTLAYWRIKNKIEIPFFKIGGKILYRKDDIDRYIESCYYGVASRYRCVASYCHSVDTSSPFQNSQTDEVKTIPCNSLLEDQK